jgi:hypothetical protein
MLKKNTNLNTVCLFLSSDPVLPTKKVFKCYQSTKHNKEKKINDRTVNRMCML